MRQFSSAMRRSSGRRVAVGAAASAVILLGLAACTGGSGDSDNSPVANGTSIPSQTFLPAPPATTAAPEPAVITTRPTGQHVSPVRPVVVGIENGRLTSVTMVNPDGKQVRGELNADATSWHTTEDLGYSKRYKIVAHGVNEAGTPVTRKSHFTTLTPDNMTMPYIEDIYGHFVDDGGVYGVGMVVRVHFDEQVDEAKAERTLSVTTTPAVTGGWYWADSQNVYWRPQSYYAPDTEVTVSANVYGKDVGQGLYGQADQSVSFRIGARHYSVANAKTHKVYVFFNGKRVRTMPTSMGQGGTVQGKNGPIYLWTMPGIYTVINHENPAIMSSDSYGLPANSPLGYAPEKVYWSTKISVDGIYLHELDATVWAQGHQNVSHGCLNLNYDNAHWFYLHSRIGDIVRVVHSGGPAITFNQGGQWSVPWSEWLKGSALH